jgi:adenosylcobinamide-GDP ribazoletransferase
MKAFLSPLALAFMTLTRLPVPFASRIEWNETTSSRSAAWFPLVGLFYGGLTYGVWRLLGEARAPVEVQAFLLLALPYAVNRFFHLDGFSDVADAFFADRSPEERLRIMKDPHVGSFAVGSVVLFLLYRYLLLKLFLQWSHGMWPLLLVPVFSRFAMVLLARISSYPRTDGTAAHLVGRIPNSVFVASLLVLFACLLPSLHVGAPIRGILFFLGITIAAVCLFRSWCRAKIGGVTGDCLGALCELLEAALLSASLILTLS